MKLLGHPTLVSLGGNALTLGPDRVTIDDQYEATRRACKIVAKIFTQVTTVLTHGNGPQVGFIMQRFEGYKRQGGTLHIVPLYAIVADTQGAIGFMMANALRNELIGRGLPGKADRIQTLVTQVVVDENDPAFGNPTKPIGVWINEREAMERQTLDHWVVKHLDQSRENGWRRVVSSPKPTRVIEAAAINSAVGSGFLTICGGGGGIPVIEDQRGNLRGIEAVVDKDSTSELIAEAVRAKLMLILTEAQGVIHPDEYGKKTGRKKVIPIMTVSEAKTLIPGLPKGSMGPKVAACVGFTEKTGYPSVIANFGNAEEALSGDGKEGTLIVAA